VENEDGLSFDVRWEYEFFIDGFHYTGRLTVGQQDKDYLDSFIEAMRAGTPVNVLYDPNDPRRSEGIVLESELLRITPRD
jgi:hypothetical protein